MSVKRKIRAQTDSPGQLGTDGTVRSEHVGCTSGHEQRDAALWPIRRLGDITRVRTGKLDANAHRPGGAFPFFTCGEETLAIDCFAFDTEAVLLAGNGNFNVKWYKGKFNAYQRTYVIEPDGVYGKWLYYAVQAALRTITKGNRGSVIRFIRIGDIVDSTVRLPPLEEQKRIVAEIEKQFTRLEAGTAALRRVQANLKRYRGAVLKAACEGRLVPTEAELAKTEKRKAKFETGEQLLARILNERREKWAGRGAYTEPTTPDFSKTGSLPVGWKWTSLEQLLCFLGNGISKKPDAEMGLPILRISAVRALAIRLEEVRYLNAEVSEYEDYVLEKGDLLFTRYNGNPELVGVCGVVPSLNSPLVHPDKLIRCKLVPIGVLPGFVAIMANTGVSREYLSKRIRTTAGQAGISGSDLKGLPIPLPPIAEQTRIIAEVERRLSVIEGLEAMVAANLQRAARLRQAVLQRAFSGQL